MYKKIFSLGLIASSLLGVAQVQQAQPQDTIELSSVQVVAELPITNEIVTKKQIESKNLGQDMPILLQNATSMVVTSDAGAGVGYTNLRLRGIGSDQINVTFNGVPVNDSESHGVFWVDFPDISSTTEGVAIQRGVGTSSNGATSFGGSINLDTEGRTTDVFGEAMATYGSFNTKKYMFKGGTGDIANGKLNMDIRATQVNSDGYRDRATSNLSSVALNARYMPSKNTEIHLMNVYGYERTYQAWNGATREQLTKYGRTFNPSGAIYNDKSEIVGYYDDEVDNYNQNHTHLYWKQKYANGWRTKATLHYTYGLGFYENYKQGGKLNRYKIDILGKKKADAIRRKWLDNHFFGGIFNIENTRLENTKFYAGIAANKYIGDHYGEIIRLVGVNNYRQNGYYYDNQSNKLELSAFAKVLRTFGNFEVFGDLQVRQINYKGEYKDGGQNDNEEFRPFDLDYTFFNPKAGINYNFTPNSKVYVSYGMAHREPTRTDILEGGAKEAETLHDVELGYRVRNSVIDLGLNGYYMKYKNQLVLTGQLNDVGSPIRNNIGDSYRAGVELDANVAVIRNILNVFGNIAYSQNKNQGYYTKDANDKLVNHGDTDIAYSPNIVGSAGLDINPVRGLNINWANKYVSSQYVTNTEDDNLKLGDYFVSNISASYNIPLSVEESMEISFLVNNILDRKYESYGSDYGELYLFPQAGRNFLAGVKFRF